METRPSVSGPAVGPSKWDALSRDGWCWFGNVAALENQDEQVMRWADARLAEAIRVFGRENVLTGNAWRNDGPFGRPGQIGIYVKEGKT